MKRFFIPIYILVFSVLFISCKQDGFQTAEQNPADYTKLARISDLVYLHELDNEKPFKSALYIEATVNGIEANSIHVQDASGYAIRVYTNNPSAYEAGDLVRIGVGDQRFEIENAHWVIRSPQEVTKIGDGFPSSSIATLVELAAEIHKYTSKLVTLNELTFKDKRQNEHEVAYLVDQEDVPNLDFWVIVPSTLNYDMPMAISSAKGFITSEAGSISLHIQHINDIQENYVPPLLIDQIVDKSDLVNQLLNVSEEEISEGVKLVQAQYLNRSNLLTAFTLFEVDLNIEGNSIVTGLANNGNSVTARHSLVNMATSKDNALKPLGYEIIGGINGDFFALNAAPGIDQYAPFGPVVKDGLELKSSFHELTDFFGIKKDNTPFIGSYLVYNEHKASLDQALGGRRILNDGEIVNKVMTRAARTAIGYSNDNKVYLFVGDGIAENPSVPEWSNGYNTEEIAKLLKAVGVTEALYLQGARYAMAVMKNKSTNTIANISRPIWNHDAWMSSGWLIKVKQK